MKLQSRVSLLFKKDKPVDKVTFSSGVLNCLGNPVIAALFPNLPVSVESLQEINDTLNTSAIAVQTTDSRQSKLHLKMLLPTGQLLLA